MKTSIWRLAALLLAAALLMALWGCRKDEPVTGTRKTTAPDPALQEQENPLPPGGETPGASAPENGAETEPSAPEESVPGGEDSGEGEGSGGNTPADEDPAPGPEDKPDPTGSWSAELTVDGMISAFVEEDSLGGLPMPSFPGVFVVLRMDLNGDGTSRIFFDEASLRRAKEDMHAPLRQYLLDYFAQEYGLDEAAVEAALATQNTSLDQKVEELAEGFRLEELTAVDARGYYRYEDGRLYLGDDPDSLENYYEASLQGDRLTLLKAPEAESTVTLSRLLPLTFAR